MEREKERKEKGLRTRASLNAGHCGMSATTNTAKTFSTKRVRKFRQKKVAEKEEEERRKRLSRVRSRRYRDKKRAGLLTRQSAMQTASPREQLIFSPADFFLKAEKAIYSFKWEYI